MRKYVISLDQGTTSSRAIAFDSEGHKYSVYQKEFAQHFPRPGWVEHDPMDILSSQMEVMRLVAEDICREGCTPQAENHEPVICAIGITNQRETTIVWDASTGRPVYNAIVWQDRRTAAYCASFADKEDMIKAKTGLLIDPYFSATKIRWILDNVPGAREKAQKGELRFGTVDSWLVWNLSGGKAHVTDVSNASRTMIFNIHTLQWDKELLELFGIPESMLPKVCSSSEIYGYTHVCGRDIPIASVIGDQQSALFGQMCVHKGDIKNTYGTGCFLLMNTGEKAIQSKNRLLTSVAWKIGDSVNYVLEGSVFVAGAAVQWLRDGLGIIKSAAEIEDLAARVDSTDGVYFVPALTGLGAPYWNADAKGIICGITRGTTSAHIARAALEGIAFSVADVVDAMNADITDANDNAAAPHDPSNDNTADSQMPGNSKACNILKVDGGASRNNLLMQIQADILGVKVVRPQECETTALGAAYLAGLATGVWQDIASLEKQWEQEKSFTAGKTADEASSLKNAWHEAVKKSLS